MVKTVSIVGCGWLGLPLAKSLLAKGFLVKGSTTQVSKLEQLSSLGIQASLFNIGTTPFPNVPDDLLATNILVITLPFKRGFSDPTFYTDQIRHLQKAAEAAGVERCILTSSTSIYPMVNGDVNETSPIDSNDRAQALYKAEEALLNVPSLSSTIIRFAGLFGPDREPGRFFSKKPSVTGGDLPVNLIHLDDCLGILLRVIEDDAVEGVYNAVSPEHPSRKDFYTAQASATSYSLPNFAPPHDGPYKRVSSQKIQDELGYQFKTSLLSPPER